MIRRERTFSKRLAGVFLLTVGLASVATPSWADEAVSGRVKSVDMTAKKLTIVEDKSGRERVIVVGDYTNLLIGDQKVTLGRIQPGVTVQVDDSVVASDVRLGNETIGKVLESSPDHGLTIEEEGTGKRVELALTSTTAIESAHGASTTVAELKPGSRVVVVRDGGSVAQKIVVEFEPATILEDFWNNFRHNLFKPLLLFFYMGFLVPILRVKFEFPYVMYQALTIYLLIAIGWHGGEELSNLGSGELAQAVGFMGLGFCWNFVNGILAYLALSLMTRMRRVDKATVAGYYGSDSAGTFVTAVGVLTTAHIAYQAYMPVMLAVMEIPGCLVALFLVSRLRHKGMDAQGTMPDEPGYNPDAKPTVLPSGDDHGHGEHGHHAEVASSSRKSTGILSPQLLHEVFLNPGLYLLFGGILVGYISGLQGPEVTRADDSFFVTLFQGVLCLFLLEMGMTASRKLRDLRTAGPGFVAFGLIAPNILAALGIIVAHIFAVVTHTPFHLGTYVLFSVLCGAASYIAVPAVQRLAIPEASPTLPLAASLGLTFSYNVTIGIPIYIEIAKAVMNAYPVT